MNHSARAVTCLRTALGCSLLLLAACGSSGDSDNAGSTTPAGGSTGAGGSGGGAAAAAGGAKSGAGGNGSSEGGAKSGAGGGTTTGGTGGATHTTGGSSGATSTGGTGGMASAGSSATGGKASGGNSGTGGASSGTGGAGGADAGGASSGGSSAVTMPIALRTHDTAQYLSAPAAVITATASYVSKSEIFTLTDLNGGGLEDGDLVQLATPGGAFLSSENGGGGALLTISGPPGDNETYAITRLAGPGTIASSDEIALKAKSKVSYVSAINGGGGEVRVDAPWAKAWETFGITLDAMPTQPSSARQKVLDYLSFISGKKTIAGQQNKDSHDPSSHTTEIAGITGKTPGFWSNDFGFGQYALDGRPTITAEAIKRWAKGDVVQFMYHNCIPTHDELCGWDDIGGANPQHLTDDEWKNLVTDGTDLNKAWIARLDVLAPYFDQLKAAGVAPLFRPLHEMNQGVFWWGGRGGPEGTRKLFQLTHDYLVNTKGFDNIIWVWDVQDFGSLSTDVSDYDPGAAYYDIAALDVYDGGYTKQNYDIMLGAAAGKPIAIGECATLPTSDELLSQPQWAFFMLWPDFIDQDKGVLPALYNSPNVITEDQMPGWN